MTRMSTAGPTSEDVGATMQRRKIGRRRVSPFPPLQGLILLIVLLGAWQLAGNAQSPYFPPPSSWWSGLSGLWSSGQLMPAIGATVEAFLLSLVIATVLGSVVGFAMGAVRIVDRALNPTLEFLRTMPPATIVPIFVLLIGYNLGMKLTIVVFAAVWPVMLSTRSAMSELSPTLTDVGRTLRLSRYERLRKIVVPALIPSVLLGVRVAAPLTLIITLLVEILTQVSGLGALIAKSQTNFESAQVYGLVAVAGVIALLLSILITLLDTYVNRYRAGQS